MIEFLWLVFFMFMIPLHKLAILEIVL